MKGCVILLLRPSKYKAKHFAKNPCGAKNKLKKAVTVLFSAAVVATTIPIISMSANAQSAIFAKTTDYLNLRNGASANSSVIDVLNNGSEVEILEIENSGFCKVRTESGTVGYCSADYLNITTDAKTVSMLNIYNKASKNGNVLRTVSPGMTLDVLSLENNSWAKVKLDNGTTGYAETAYLTFLSENGDAVGAVRQVNAAVKNNFSLSTNSLKLKVNGSIKLVPQYGTGTIKYKSSNSNVASVSSNGWVQGVSEGSATITATDSGTKKTAKCTVKVYKTDFMSITVTPKSQSILTSKSFTIKAVTNPETTGKVKFKSSDTSIAKVDGNGKVTGVSAGKATITASDSTGLVYEKCTVTVTCPDKITLSKSSVSVNAGSSVTVNATKSNSSMSIKWTSSNTNVASVNNGKISGLKAGTATITASDSSGKVKATCKVTVNGVSSGSLSVSHSTRTTSAGKTIYIKGYGSGKWETSDSSIATVSEGFIYCKKPGTAAISYADSSGHKAICVVNVYEAAPVRFAYSSPNSATLNSNVTLVAITDKDRTDVKFVIDVGGKNVEVKATSKTTDGNNYLWKGTYKATKAGTFNVTTYAYKNNLWKTCADGKCDIYVASKTNPKETGLNRLRASDNVIKFIGEKEGFVSSITYDTLANNIPTIGHGYVVWAGGVFYNNLTKNEGYALLVDAVNNDVYTSKVNDMLISNKIRFNQQQFDSLVSFSYNLGTGWTSSSDLKNILLNSYGTVSSGTTMTATVNSDTGLNLRKEPTTSSASITVLPYGTKVTLVSTTKYNNVWYKVKTSDGKTGYCSGTYLNISSSGGSTGRDLNYVNKNALIKEMLAYHHAGSVCYYGLLYRRADELEMFLYNDYVADGRENKHNFPDPPCISFP